MGGTKEQTVPTGTATTLDVPGHQSFVEKMECAARGELGYSPTDDPDLTGEDRFDAG